MEGHIDKPAVPNNGKIVYITKNTKKRIKP